MCDQCGPSSFDQLDESQLRKAVTLSVMAFTLQVEIDTRPVIVISEDGSACPEGMCADCGGRLQVNLYGETIHARTGQEECPDDGWPDSWSQSPFGEDDFPCCTP